MCKQCMCVYLKRDHELALTDSWVCLCDLYEYRDGPQSSGQWFLLYSKRHREGLWGDAQSLHLCCKSFDFIKLYVFVFKTQFLCLRISGKNLIKKVNCFRYRWVWFSCSGCQRKRRETHLPRCSCCSDVYVPSGFLFWSLIWGKLCMNSSGASRRLSW